VAPTVSRIGQTADRRRVISTRVRESFSDSLDILLSLPPAKFISWSQTIRTAVGMPVMQQNCLTTAVYFEARSEPVLGQLAVATVILNRVKSSNSSICGVVYKGAAHFNACQFSFACDGKPDMVDDAHAWREAQKISKLAVANDSKTYSAVLDNLSAATNYHADYVDPRWSRSLNRLAKFEDISSIRRDPQLELS
jgi:spore germination cell wall hydrolase CwlJ-like protein